MGGLMHCHSASGGAPSCTPGVPCFGPASLENWALRFLIVAVVGIVTASGEEKPLFQPVGVTSGLVPRDPCVPGPKWGGGLMTGSAFSGCPGLGRLPQGVCWGRGLLQECPSLLPPRCWPTAPSLTASHPCGRTTRAMT